MTAWIQCPACSLKHTARPDGSCPRCRCSIAAPTASREVLAASVAPPPDPGAAPALPTVAAPFAPPRAFAPAQWEARGELTVGGLFGATFSAWFGTAGAVLPLLVLLALPSAFAAYGLGVSMAAGSARVLSAALWTIVLSLLVDPPQMVLAARAAARREAGAPVEVGDLLGAAVRSYPATLVLSLLVLLVCALAVTIVGVPLVVFVLTAWTVSVPALTEERLGPIAAVRRSWELTRGARWQLLGAFVLIALCVFFAWIAVQAALTISLGAVRGGAAGRREALELIGWSQAANTLTQALAGSIFSTATGVAYAQLRARGGGAADLRRVFE